MIVRTEDSWTAATPNKQSTAEGSVEFRETLDPIRRTTLDQMDPFQSFEYGPVSNIWPSRHTPQLLILTRQALTEATHIC